MLSRRSGSPLQYNYPRQSALSRWFLMGAIETILLISILAILVVYTIFSYNGLVRRRNDVEEAYRQIDVQLKRRYNLIPHLLKV